MPDDEGRQTPLLEVHERLGARLTDFAGWGMPLHYEGIVAEHLSVRSAVGVFDVSHLGKLRVSGPDAGSALRTAVTADQERARVGRAAYGLVLADDGGCLDDVFVYRMATDDWLVVPNAANVESVARAIAGAGAEVRDERDAWAILAIQGPDSFEVFDRAWPRARASELRLHAWRSLDLGGADGFVARTGYTGERGFELFAPAQTAPEAFERLLGLGVRPVGLGARDTLRLEMGYPLYGHELAPDINPLEAGLGWALAWAQPFSGRDALRRIEARGPARRLVGVRCDARAVPREGYPLLVDDEQIGAVTSGNFSPTLGVGIALALADAARVPPPDTAVAIGGRRRSIPGTIVKPPFVTPGSR